MPFLNLGFLAVKKMLKTGITALHLAVKLIFIIPGQFLISLMKKGCPLIGQIQAATALWTNLYVKAAGM